MQARRLIKIFIFLISFLIDVSAFAESGYTSEKDKTLDNMSSSASEETSSGELSGEKDFTNLAIYVNISQK